MWFTLIFLACNDFTMNKVAQRKPELVVYPEIIEFGHFLSGFESGQSNFVVINAGDEDLIISKPEIESEHDKFSLSNNLDENYTIMPGETQEFDVYYSPQTYEEKSSIIQIISNDEDESEFNLPVTGFGDAPAIRVNPEETNYENIVIGCSSEESITVRNVGNLDLTINTITQMITQPADMVVDYGTLPDLPWVIQPSQEVDFLIKYIPTDVGTDYSSIIISSNDPIDTDVEITQSGNADFEYWFTDTFEQEDDPILDILWVIDNSGSMAPFKTHLSINLSSFMSVFSQSGADYHMSGITTDDYTFSTVVTPQTQYRNSVLSGLVQTGIMGSGYEKGIEMSVLSLSNSSFAGPGGAFFREEALLVIIYVSDEPDQSEFGWSSYISFFDNLKTPGEFIPYAVIGDIPNGCTYNGYGQRITQAGYGYSNLVNYYGGGIHSICSQDWGTQLQVIANEVTNRQRFPLSEDNPVEESIKVYVNGQEATEWTWDSIENWVVFNSGHIPDPGQTITIEYAAWACEE